MRLTSAMTANSDRGVTFSASEGDWQLGTEPELPVIPSAEAELPRNRSHERLDRPLHTLTAEHCGWLLLVAYAAFSRLVMLSARPLDASEATRALAALSDYSGSASVVPQPGWISVITSALSALGGPSDWSVRVVPALCGLLLIVTAFGLRRYIGRAGALALALLLTLSPGLTFYARSNSPEIPAALMALASLYAFCQLIERPSTTRAVWLGIAIGLLSATPPDGRIAEVSFALALSLIGFYCLVRREHPLLNVGVWFKRYRGLLLIVVIVMVCASIASQLFTGAPPDIASGDPVGQADTAGTGLGAALQCCLAPLLLDEFLIVGAAIVGIVAVLSARIHSMLAAWILLWALLSVALTMMVLSPNAASLPLILLPLAVLGAIGMEWLHHTNAWSSVRIIGCALAVLTLYVQILGNFVYYAPDASEAAWNRHANLYWDAMTTTLQTRIYCRRAMAGITPEDAKVYFEVDAPALRWYLRELRPVKEAAIAAVTVGPPSANDGSKGSGTSGSSEVRRFDFDYAMSWPLTWSALTPASALRYIFTGEAWANPVTAAVRITSHPSNPSTPMLDDLNE
jgi:Dolichyl-phosphate-mannose-protein mannosyltransferase